MNIVEQMARYIAARLGLPFEDVDAPASVFSGWLPESPARAVCVCAAGLRPSGDADGTRVQVVIRSDGDSGWPLDTAVALTALLDEARDVAFVPEGHYVTRVTLERAFEFNGADDRGNQFHAAEFRVYNCD